MNLPDIVAASASLWERLAGNAVITEASKNSRSRLDQWQAALAAADLPDPAARLTKRLAWDGLTCESISPALGEAHWDETQPLPDWAARLPLVSQAACELGYFVIEPSIGVEAADIRKPTPCSPRLSGPLSNALRATPPSASNC